MTFRDVEEAMGDPALVPVCIPKVWMERALAVMVAYGTHQEYDCPGDTPEACGQWCDICKQHIDDDDHSQGHAVSCVIEIFRMRLAK